MGYITLSGKDLQMVCECLHYHADELKTTIEGFKDNKQNRVVKVIERELEEVHELIERVKRELD